MAFQEVNRVCAASAEFLLVSVPVEAAKIRQLYWVAFITFLLFMNVSIRSVLLEWR